MNTNRSARNIVVVIIIAILASMLSACSGDLAREGASFVVNAVNSEESPAGIQSLQMSPRIESCGLSEHQNLINTLNNENLEGITIGAWLDSKMSSYPCIAK